MTQKAPEEEKVKKIDFREKFLSDDDFKKKTVKWKNHKVEIRELSAKERGKVYSESTVTRQKRGSKDIIQEVDQTKLNVWAVVYQAYDPVTGTKIFSKKDFDALASLPSSVIDVLAKPALEMLGEDLEEEEKN